MLNNLGDSQSLSVHFCLGEPVTHERKRQNGGVISEVISSDYSGRVYVKRYKAKYPSALDHYFVKGYINAKQYEAGLTAKEIYGIALQGLGNTQLSPETLTFQTNLNSKDEKMAEFLGAIEELNGAWEKLTPKQKLLVRKVCGFDEYTNVKDDKKTLARGLEAMALYWKSHDKEKHN